MVTYLQIAPKEYAVSSLQGNSNNLHFWSFLLGPLVVQMQTKQEDSKN